MMIESYAVTPSIFGVANSASMNATGQVSPGEIISLVGSNLGPSNPVTASLAGGQQAISSQLGGVQMLFDGVAAPLLYVSSTQINATVPFGTADRTDTKMVFHNAGASSNEALLGVVPAAPAVFVTQATNHYLPVAAALNEDGSINSPTNRAAPGSIISIFATGCGALAPQPADGSVVSLPLPELEQNIDMFGPGFIQVLYAGAAAGRRRHASQLPFA